MNDIEVGLKSLGEPFSIHSPDYIVRYANDAALSMAGLKREEVIGRKCYEVFHGLKGPPPNCPLRPSYESGRTKTAEMGAPYFPEEYIVTTHPIPSANGEATQILHFFKNITGIKKKGITENERLTFFTDLITHEMDNYIYSTLVAFDLYKNSPDSNSREEYFNMARGHVIRSKIFMDNVKKLLWLEEEREPILKGSVEPVIEEAISILQKIGDEKRFNINVSRDIGSVSAIANDLLVDVFLNIFDSSVRRSPTLPADITVSVKDCKEDPSFYRFEISDRSGGIPDDQKEAISERPRPVSNSLKGDSVGLLLARKIVEKYGGRFWIEDFINKNSVVGTTFIFLLKKG